MTPNYELLKDAYAIIDGIPENRFVRGLCAWYAGDDCDGRHLEDRAAFDCNTMACAAGWLALHPHFQAIGLEPTFNGILSPNECGMNAVAEIFGIKEGDATNMFAMRGWSKYDDAIAIANNPVHVSDKGLFLARVKAFLEEKGQLTPAQA